MKYPACTGQQKSGQGFESCQRPEQQGHEYRGDQGGASDIMNALLIMMSRLLSVSMVSGDGDDDGGDKEQIEFAQVEIEELCKSEKEVKLKQVKLQTLFSAWP